MAKILGGIVLLVIPLVSAGLLSASGWKVPAIMWNVQFAYPFLLACGFLGVKLLGDVWPDRGLPTLIAKTITGTVVLLGMGLGGAIGSILFPLSFGFGGLIIASLFFAGVYLWRVRLLSQGLKSTLGGILVYLGVAVYLSFGVTAFVWLSALDFGDPTSANWVFGVLTALIALSVGGPLYFGGRLLLRQP